MGLDHVIEKILAANELNGDTTELCRQFLSAEDAVLSESFTGKRLLEKKLHLFLIMNGVIPRILPNGKVRHFKRINDLAFLGYSYFTRTSKKNSAVDTPFNRLMLNIVKQNTDPARNGPSVESLINEIGSHRLIVQRYGRPVSYDDVLPPENLMQKYMTGQRAVRIQIGTEVLDMVPEALDDLWVLNPEFIRQHSDERLYHFWRRVGNKQWKPLIDQVGQERRVSEYLQGVATYEAVTSNQKAIFIKKSSLPRSKINSEELSMPKDVTYEEFRNYVPLNQLQEASFKKRTLSEARRNPLPLNRLVAIAEEVGLKGMPGANLEGRVKRIMHAMEEFYEGANPNDPDPQNPTPYYGLTAYLGENGESVRSVLYDTLVQVIQEHNPKIETRYARSSAGRVIRALEEGNILTRGHLEELLHGDGFESVKGLVSIDPSQRARITYLEEACRQLDLYEQQTPAAAATQ